MKTILIIEDSEQNLYLTRFILERHGFRVVSAPDGPTGIASALQNRPALILLDIQLPGMDGYQVASSLRGHSELLRTPIVAVTSYAMTGDRERVMEAGCTGYLEKPINPDTFISDVERFLAAAESACPRAIDGRLALVVDDLQANRDYLRAILEGTGWQVASADDGADALRLARQRAPDLVITDILMPRMDGFSFCREWRRDAALHEIPFIFYTATYTDDRDRAFGLSLGADAFLLKPMEPAELLDRIHETLERRPPRAHARADSPPTPSAEVESLRQYNAVLVRKLEDKMLQVEALNRDLERRVLDRTRELEAANAKLQAFGQIGTWVSEREPTPKIEWSEETCRIFGIDPQEFDSRIETFLGRVHPEDRLAVRKAGEEVWSGRRRLNLQHRILHPDGEVHWVQQEGELQRDPHGNPVRLVGVVREITEFRLLEDQLRQSQKMEAIGRLAAGVAHDFGNVLTIIRGHASLATSYSDVSAPVADSLSQIVHATDLATTLTRQLLAFSRQHPVQLRPVNLNEVVSGMARMLSSLVGRMIHLQEALDPRLPLIQADASMLEQVVMNLVVNARDAMPEGGPLTLATSFRDWDAAAAARHGLPQPGAYVTLSIRDSGVGIAAEDVPRIFEPFFSTKPESTGTGLGLSVVYGIIQQHRGHVEVQSTPGVGTRIDIHLPAT